MFTAGGAGSTPGQGTKIPHATSQSKKSGSGGGSSPEFLIANEPLHLHPQDHTSKDPQNSISSMKLSCPTHTSDHLQSLHLDVSWSPQIQQTLPIQGCLTVELRYRYFLYVNYMPQRNKNKEASFKWSSSSPTLQTPPPEVFLDLGQGVP